MGRYDHNPDAVTHSFISGHDLQSFSTKIVEKMTSSVCDAILDHFGSWAHHGKGKTTQNLVLLIRRLRQIIGPMEGTGVE